MNGDGRVSVSDLISLGRFIGLSGAQRNDITYPFRSGQQADNWNYVQPNGINIKHIDANEMCIRDSGYSCSQND